LRKFIYLASDEIRSQISTLAPFLFQVPQDLISWRGHNGWIFNKLRTDQNQTGTIFCSKIEMVQLLVQRQHIAFVNQISTLKVFKALSEAGEAFEINVDCTRSIIGGTASHKH
jgi:primase-polymerase (primpol)-like protein